MEWVFFLGRERRLGHHRPEIANPIPKPPMKTNMCDRTNSMIGWTVELPGRIQVFDRIGRMLDY
jgi:hypothetical protein